jgi:hypothetical protein
MQRRSVGLAVLVTAATLFAVGQSLSQPRVDPRVRPDGRIGAAPAGAPAPNPRPAPAAPVAMAPAPSPGPNEAPSAGTATTCPTGGDMTYTTPASMAPVTNRNTCRHQGRSCCSETRDWCLSEGFLWQSCKNCYCGSQCMGPSLID